MVIELKMCRFENVPWGFRLIGGSDFEVPLTVVKVTEGSLAEVTGMRVGDIIARINDEPTSNMTHNDAHQVISKCGNVFFLGIIREEDYTENEETGEDTVLRTVETEDYGQDDSSYIHTTNEVYSTDVQTSADAHIQTTETSEEHVSEEIIAAMMSGEAEVLKEHNVLGIFPKAGICQSSEVFRTLNEEAVKTKTEIEKEKRKWTTFLQKPNRPIPISKQELENQSKSEPYKVKIVKQPKRPLTPTPSPQPETVAIDEEKESIVEEEIKAKPEEEEESLENPTDTEVPNLEDVSVSHNDEDILPENIDEHIVIVDHHENGTAEENIAVGAASEQNNDEKNEPSPVKTEEELVLEKQLADVQKQLMALSSLPSTIQATLDAVTKQLSELLPTFKLQPQSNVTCNTISEEKKTQEEQSSAADEIDQHEDGNPVLEDQDEAVELTQIVSDSIDEDNYKNEVEHVRPPEPTEKFVEKQLVEEDDPTQEELQYKKQKNQREQLKEELEQRLIKEKAPRRRSHAFGPLTPQQRPLVLPGGRRWRTPKDAFNEEFIAEVLSSQAELIVGTTLGSSYESPLLGYDNREYSSMCIVKQYERGVNFLKYQKPEKRIDLEKSEVYKVVHHLEREPRRGIEARPPKVMAEADVLNRATPMLCG